MGSFLDELDLGEFEDITAGRKNAVLIFDGSKDHLAEKMLDMLSRGGKNVRIQVVKKVVVYNGIGKFYKDVCKSSKSKITVVLSFDSDDEFSVSMIETMQLSGNFLKVEVK